jgi:hypothetical protein
MPPETLHETRRPTSTPEYSIEPLFSAVAISRSFTGTRVAAIALLSRGRSRERSAGGRLHHYLLATSSAQVACNLGYPVNEMFNPFPQKKGISMKYVGVDVHKQTITLCVVEQ